MGCEANTAHGQLREDEEPPMRFLTVEECVAFDVVGGQNEVTPVIEDGKVVAVLIYTGHASGWREPRRRDYGHQTYGNLVAAADKRAASAPFPKPANEKQRLENLRSAIFDEQ